jgi:hypothetical protein
VDSGWEVDVVGVVVGRGKPGIEGDLEVDVDVEGVVLVVVGGIAAG